ncbi:MAG: hypothetical protein L0206_21280, partial [Actinobacteria bacterium]|nr:hypothetical protein [Actinomycetota bacterium]
DHVIQASGEVRDGAEECRVLNVGVTVSRDGGGGGGQLAFTGSNSLMLLVLALLALTIGTALVVGSRRRAAARERLHSA